MRGELVNLYATSELHSIESALWVRGLPGKKITNYSRAPLMGPLLFVGSVFVFSIQSHSESSFWLRSLWKRAARSTREWRPPIQNPAVPTTLHKSKASMFKGLEKKKGVGKRERDRQKKVEWTKVLSSHMKLVYQPPPLALHKTHTHTHYPTSLETMDTVMSFSD